MGHSETEQEYLLNRKISKAEGNQCFSEQFSSKGQLVPEFFPINCQTKLIALNSTEKKSAQENFQVLCAKCYFFFWYKNDKHFALFD